MSENIINVLGTVAAFLTTISFLPQAIKTITTRCTKGISILMYLAFTIGIFMWCIYGYYINDMILLISSIITLIFAFPVMVLTIHNAISMSPRNLFQLRVQRKTDAPT